MKLKSKIGSIPYSDEKVYNFLTNFDNFKKLIPQDKITNWQSDADSCKFTVNPIGDTGVRIIEKEPNKLVKLKGIEESKFDFTFWMQLKSVDENDTRMKLTLEASLNPMLEMMAKKPLQEFLDKVIDQLEQFKF